MATAVLVPLYPRDGDLVAVFTERRADLRRHAGEISFPGGHQEDVDEDLRETAMREAEEEIGLPRAEVELVGALPPVGTFVTGYALRRLIRRGVPVRMPTYTVDGHLVWGATARIVRSLLERVPS